MNKTLLISYARSDGADFARRLENLLHSEGYEPWRDQSSIRGISPGDAWWLKIQETIVESSIFLFVLTPGSLESEVCRRELDVALAANKPVWPLKAAEIDSAAMPELLSLRNWIDFTDGWGRGAGRLLAALSQWRDAAPDASIHAGDGSRAQAEAVPADAPPSHILGLAPAKPPLFVGREATMAELKERLGVGRDGGPSQSVTALFAYPGMGKTATASMLAHDPDVAAAFPGGVLWADLGQEPDLVQELGNWGRDLGNDTLRHHTHAELDQAAGKLRALLRDRRALLIVDDVWEAAHGSLFLEARGDCPIVLTTRFTELARGFALTPDGRYRLRELDPGHAVELLRRVAPEAVDAHPDACRQLVQSLEGLPLAILVAGKLLAEEQELFGDVTQLVDELRSGARLLDEVAPSDRSEFQQETAEVPTIGALLQRSVDTLPAEGQQRFAELGAFREKPATFDLDALKALWLVDDPKPSIGLLSRRGLIEPAREGRFQMHALLHSLAESRYRELLEETESASDPSAIDPSAIDLAALGLSTDDA